LSHSFFTGGDLDGRIPRRFGVSAAYQVSRHLLNGSDRCRIIDCNCLSANKAGLYAGISRRIQRFKREYGTWNVLNLQNSQNNQKQYYMSSQATVINNDTLRITASKPASPVGGKSYLSARLETKATFGPGSY
jgi:hypothetical protein